MADQMSQTTQQVTNAILASGFPFQTAVAEVIRQVKGCTVVEEEFPWRDEAGTDQFLDLVVKKSYFRVCVECKKTQKEALTFLRPRAAGSERDGHLLRCMYLNETRNLTEWMVSYCADWQFVPMSAESAFCVVSTTSSGKDQRLLERDAQRLVRGTDAYAGHLKAEFNRTQDHEPKVPIIPVIVTNAKLFVVEYEPMEVSLETGQFPVPLPATLSSVEYIRFRKAFTSGGRDVGERTVFVVSAVAFAAWLGRLDVLRGPNEKGRVQIS
jgi:hypothetical protein